MREKKHSSVYDLTLNLHTKITGRYAVVYDKGKPKRSTWSDYINTNKTERNKHKKLTCEKDEPKKCKICNLCFASQFKMEIHIASVHKPTVLLSNILKDAHEIN